MKKVTEFFKILSDFLKFLTENFPHWKGRHPERTYFISRMLST